MTLISPTDPPAQADTVDANLFRSTMAHFPTFVTVLSSAGPHGPVGCTVNAMMSLSVSPPTVVVSLVNSSSTLRELRAAGRFGISGLSWDQREYMRHFACGDPMHRFDGVAYETHAGVPVLTEAPTRMACMLVDAVPVLDHTLLIGTVTWADQHPRGTPLVYYEQQPHPMAVAPC